MAGILDELLGVVPRLIGRTREQVDVVARLVAQLPCVNRVLVAEDRPPADDGELADVVELRPPAADTVPAGRPVAGSRRRADGSVAVGAPDRMVLPIPGYDDLAASQVIPRLEGLGPDELEAVRTYEHAHRGRRTILARIGQLQTG